MATAFSFPPLATGSIPTYGMLDPAASTGLLPSIRTSRTERGASTAIPAISAGASTTVTTGDLSVLFHINGSLGLVSAKQGGTATITATTIDGGFIEIVR